MGRDDCPGHALSLTKKQRDVEDPCRVLFGMKLHAPC